jgi:hypothetical protein
MKVMPLFIIRCAFAVAAYIMAVSAAMATPTGESIEKSMQRAVAEFHVPCMAVSVVYDGDFYNPRMRSRLESEYKYEIRLNQTVRDTSA